MAKPVSSIILAPSIVSKLVGWTQTCTSMCPNTEISKRPLNDTYTLWNNRNYGGGRVLFIDNTKTRTTAARIDLRDRESIRIVVEYKVVYEKFGDAYEDPDPFPNLSEIVKILEETTLPSGGPPHLLRTSTGDGDRTFISRLLHQLGRQS